MTMRLFSVLPILLLVLVAVDGQTDPPVVVSVNRNDVSFLPDPQAKEIPPVLQIAEINNGNVSLNHENLGTIFDQLEDGETEVGILSIAGEFRKGKSFLLNFFLQYLKYRAAGNPPADPTTSADELQALVQNARHPWFRDVDMRSGFHFQSGIKRDTKGIKMYSKPFVVKKSDGTKLAVVVMDTQGLYDPSTSSNDNIKLFAMTSLLTSSLIFNTAGNINSKQVMELRSFRDYATSASALINGTKPFQRLTFLIRDFTLGEFGWTGGEEVLQQFMGSDGEEEMGEVQVMARNLSASFSHVDAFTLPFPGSRVVRKTFDGSLVNIEPEFLFFLERLVINMTESLEARKPLLIGLRADNTVSYITSVANTINDQLPPDELMRLNERRLMMRTFAQTETFVKEYENKMQDPLSHLPDGYFLVRDLAQVMDEMEARNQEVADDIQRRFSRLDYAYSYFDVGTNGSIITAMQYLRKQMQTRYRQMFEHLKLIAGKRIESAVREKREMEAKEEEEKQRIVQENRRRHEQARREFENFLREQNERRRKEREASFWERIMAFLNQVAGMIKYMIVGPEKTRQPF